MNDRRSAVLASVLVGTVLAGMVGCSDAVSPSTLVPDGGPGGDGGTPVLRDAGVACQKVVNRVDGDGDGYLVNDPLAPPSCGDPGSSGYTSSFDCDDADPSVSLIGYRDEDGDGCVLRDETKCVGSGTAGYVVTGDPASRLDCDDRDAAICRYSYFDADGDGFGADSPSCAPLGPGLTSLTGDCDDSNPDVNPLATELAGDGADTDCDGMDADPRDPPVFPIDTTCLGPDLFFADEDSWHESCGRISFRFVVGNRGTAAAVGLLSVTGGFLPNLEIPIDLAPGDVLPAVTVHPGGLGVGVELLLQGDPECTIENNRTTESAAPCP